MKETLKMMKSIIEGYETTKSTEELVKEYQYGQDTNILAYIFVKNYSLIIRVSNRYGLLDTQDIASFCLQELDKAMKRFDFSKQCSFMTFFCRCLSNRLYVETNKIKQANSIANYLLEDLPEYEEIVDTKFTFDKLSDYNLTKIQNDLCNYLLDGYSCREIAKMLNVSHTTIYNRINKIGKILTN